MGIARGPNIVKDNLVFGYDTGHGVADNETSTRFYPGEPTTNLYTNSDFNSETGWTFGSWHNNAVTHTSVSNVIGRDGRTCKAEKLYIGASSSASHFHQYNQGKYTSGNTYTTSAWVKGSGTFAIKSHWGGNTNFTMTGEWQRVSMTVTATSSSSSHFPYFAGEGLTVGSYFYITDVQTELKSHATPYVYSGGSTGSRSNTTGLIDLKRNTNINLSNVSFNSTGQPTFDGTDDEINTGITTQLTDFSCVVVFKDNSSAAWGRLVDKSYTTGFFISSYFASVGAGYVGCGIIEPSSPHGQALQYDTSKYNYFVVTRSGSTHTIYLNGSTNKSQKTNGSSATLSSTEMTIGAWSGSTNTQRYTGEIPVVKLYNRQLTAEEIQQDFNTYKNRFNI